MTVTVLSCFLVLSHLDCEFFSETSGHSFGMVHRGRVITTITLPFRPKTLSRDCLLNVVLAGLRSNLQTVCLTWEPEPAAKTNWSASWKWSRFSVSNVATRQLCLQLTVKSQKCSKTAVKKRFCKALSAGAQVSKVAVMDQHFSLSCHTFVTHLKFSKFPEYSPARWTTALTKSVLFTLMQLQVLLLTSTKLNYILFNLVLVSSCVMNTLVNLCTCDFWGLWRHTRALRLYTTSWCEGRRSRRQT